MSARADSFDSLVAGLEGDRKHAELFRRLLHDYPEELTMEVLTAALRHGLISSAEAVRTARECDFRFRKTLAALDSLCARRGWNPQELVLEALEGQPH